MSEKLLDCAMGYWFAFEDRQDRLIRGVCEVKVVSRDSISGDVEIKATLFDATDNTLAMKEATLTTLPRKG